MQQTVLQKEDGNSNAALDHSTGHISKDLENIIDKTISVVIRAGMLPSSDISYGEVPDYVIKTVKLHLSATLQNRKEIKLDPTKIEYVVLAFDTVRDELYRASETQDQDKRLLELAYKFAFVEVEYFGLRCGQDRSNRDLPNHYMAALKSLAKITSTILRSLGRNTYKEQEERLLTGYILLSNDKMLLHNAVEIKDKAAIAFSNKYIADNLVEFAKRAEELGEDAITIATQDDKDISRRDELSDSLKTKIIEYYQDALMKYQQAVKLFTELIDHGNTSKNLTPADIKAKLIESLKGVEFTGLKLNSIIPKYSGNNPERRNTLYTEAAGNARTRYQTLEAGNTGN
ncbi:hypothetical protein HYU06_07115 [Candidatus Woesearchaeota archaeon]|nr:hypothetical protein [Candidatus Woesearchaeota archaeon]